MSRIALTAIAFDAGTQIRAALDQQVVADYAEAMTGGAQFPPIVLFHDGSQHYLADGFHRFMAAQRIEWREIDAEIRPGTKEDALWFALSANRANGQRLTERDVKHAILMAVNTWPDRSGKQIAEQIGCSQRYVATVKEQVRATANLPDRVTGKDGKTYPASRPTERPAVHPQHDAIVGLVQAGKSSKEIGSTLNVRGEVVAAVRRSLGVARPDTSREAVEHRREVMRKMAQEGHTSRQIAAACGLSDVGCRVILKEQGIDVHADKVTRNTHHHDANRIVDTIVAEAENLTEGVQLVDFSTLHRDRLHEWIASLGKSRKALDTFIRRLQKEREKHGAAA